MSLEVNAQTVQLSPIDRKLLKVLLSPNGEIKSTKNISEKLGVPVATLRRRRKRLERDFLKFLYVLDIEKFGWRRVDFFISMMQGRVDPVANALVNLDDVTYVGKSIGEHTIELDVIWTNLFKRIMSLFN